MLLTELIFKTTFEWWCYYCNPQLKEKQKRTMKTSNFQQWISFAFGFVTGEQGGIKCTGEWTGKRHFLVWAEGRLGGRLPGTEAQRHSHCPPFSFPTVADSVSAKHTAEASLISGIAGKLCTGCGPVIEEWLKATLQYQPPLLKCLWARSQTDLDSLWALTTLWKFKEYIQ